MLRPKSISKGQYSKVAKEMANSVSHLCMTSKFSQIPQMSIPLSYMAKLLFEIERDKNDNNSSKMT